MKFLLTPMLIMLFMTSCKETQPSDPQMQDLRNASVSGYVKHHGAAISLAKVYIKLNSSEFPGTNTTLYSDSTIAGSSGEYSLDKLPKGNHYIYALGFDQTVNEKVLGGIPLNIKTSGETLIADIPVTE